MKLSTFFARAQRWIARRTRRRLLALRGDVGVVSFSFDDAPQSACQLGAAILEKHGCRGSWYVAGSLTDQMDQGHMSHSVQDIQRLHRGGHHIGCHSFSHVSCTQISRAEMQVEFQRNDDFLAALGYTERPLHFSYPFGAFGLVSKQVAGQRFASCRITGGGAQTGSADLNALTSVRLYSKDLSVDAMRELIQANAQKKGWLIFYTHDVAPHPSTWGCTPELLDSAVQMALSAGCAVLPVDQAIQHWHSTSLSA